MDLAAFPEKATQDGVGSSLFSTNAFKTFQPWRDYMGLSHAIQDILGLKPAAEPPGSVDDVCAALGSWRIDTSDPSGGVSPSPPARVPNCEPPITRRARPAASDVNGVSVPRRRRGSKNRRSRICRDGGDSKAPPSARMMCSFCKHNGESPQVYSSHWLKNRSGEIVCPYLRKYVCPLCGASGARAHTKRFCPEVDPAYSSIYVKGA
ncbi:uncharacterized protein LOC128754223 [Synchiropus splendidus]|uniref:uncharacterized protein LOC128753984 n=1 Tax=Synchiropus splendidus TaxID=270530 RepID=UPI00237E0CD1|nr:uncharacterized protein LOC128753984 [Synchiropus splendidus]XP_053712671.1 uncharacterized protein LOC128754223 [Synchiropus splendidus]